MRQITRYRQLSSADRRLFFRALFIVVLIRVALWTIPFWQIQKWVDIARQPVGNPGLPDRARLKQVAWAVEAAASRVPAASCLTQSMVTQILLGRMGQPSELHLGVARSRDGKFQAHAWVEARGRVINGGAARGFDRFVRLED